MSRQRARQRWATVVALVLVAGCNNDPPVQTINVALKAGQVYQYPTVGGDEEGARLVTQARHFAVSEIRRDAQTNWVATYIYQPEEGYLGLDGAEIEVLTGSDGASPPKKVTRIVFRFNVQK